jgi:hypothetical protein
LSNQNWLNSSLFSKKLLEIPKIFLKKMVVHPYHRPTPGQFPAPNVQQARQAAIMMEMAKIQQIQQQNAAQQNGGFIPHQHHGVGGLVATTQMPSGAYFNRMVQGRPKIK